MTARFRSASVSRELMYSSQTLSKDASRMMSVQVSCMGPNQCAATGCMMLGLLAA